MCWELRCFMFGGTLLHLPSLVMLTDKYIRVQLSAKGFRNVKSNAGLSWVDN